MNYHKISIVTPSFNQGQFIEQTIDSVLSQNYPNLEYIVIDGGSRDESVKIIKKYAKHLSYWVSEPDRGQTHAINKGFKKSTGDIFNWLNSDDYYDSDCLATIDEAFHNKSILAVLGRSRIFQAGEPSRISKGTFVDPCNLAKTIGMAQIDQPATFFRTSAIRDIFPLSEKLECLMDRELWIKFLLDNQMTGLLSLDIPIVNFRIHDESKTGSGADDFNNEREGLFLSIIEQLNLNNCSNFIEKNFASISDYSFKSSYITNYQKVLTEAINYYLLLLMDETYYAKKYTVANNLKKLINADILAETDKRFLKLLSLKNKIRMYLWQRLM